MDDSFGVARFIITILEFFGWLTVIAGILVLALAAGDWLRARPDIWQAVASILVPAGIIFAGLLQIASAQITKALVSIAETNQIIVKKLDAPAAAARISDTPRYEPPVQRV